MLNLTSNRTFENLARHVEQAQRDFHNGHAKLDRVKKQLGEFTLLNLDNIDKIDLSGFREQQQDAQIEIDVATSQFNDAKAGLLAFIEGQRLEYFG
jgi:hypothetical protein